MTAAAAIAVHDSNPNRLAFILGCIAYVVSSLRALGPVTAPQLLEGGPSMQGAVTDA
jgi:hypothetical protein